MGTSTLADFVRQLHCASDDPPAAGLQGVQEPLQDDWHVALHVARMFVPAPPANTTEEGQVGSLAQCTCLSPALVSVGGVLLPHARTAPCAGEPPAASAAAAARASTLAAWAATPTASANLRQLALAMCQRLPVLLEGPAGCGKSALLRQLTRLTGNADMVEIHLDDQIDSKTLLGSYVCADVPGEFVWQPGALTRAVRDGQWVVIEDVDRAPFEVMSALVPLLESQQLPLPGRGEVLRAATSFRLFATRTTAGLDGGAAGTEQALAIDSFLHNLWARVTVAPLPPAELKDVMRHRHPALPPHVLDRMEATFTELTMSSGGGVSSAAAAAAAPGHTSMLADLRRHWRAVSARDLLKWAARVAHLTPLHDHAGREMLTEAERLGVLVEAADVLLAALPRQGQRQQVASALGTAWGLHPDALLPHMRTGRPEPGEAGSRVTVGRVTLPVLPRSAHHAQEFAHTSHALRLMEQLAAAVHMQEPVLLVGETGAGKTSVVQHLAALMGQALVVQNLNVQSESADLLGGFKPVDLRHIAVPLYQDCLALFRRSTAGDSAAAPSASATHDKFMKVLHRAFERRDWPKFVRGLEQVVRLVQPSSELVPPGRREQWATFAAGVARFKRQMEQVEHSFAFEFVEGALVQALRQGHWILLDEVNLASNETLQRLSGLLDGPDGTLTLTERGDVSPLPRHPNFRLFAAMNPPTDVGKKDLPPALRVRFTELFVDEVEDAADLELVASKYLQGAPKATVHRVVQLYLTARSKAATVLQDGAQQRPRYSLRTLCRALQFAQHCLASKTFGLEQALYEGLCMSFLTQLDAPSQEVLHKLIRAEFRPATRINLTKPAMKVRNK